MVMLLQVNLCQKCLFLNQLTHYMTTDCPWNYQFSTWKLQAQNMLCRQIVCFLFWHSEQFTYTSCSELVVFMLWTGKSMNNLLSYCGLVDARTRASDKDLPVKKSHQKCSEFYLVTILQLKLSTKLKRGTIQNCTWFLQWQTHPELWHYHQMIQRFVRVKFTKCNLMLQLLNNK